MTPEEMIRIYRKNIETCFEALVEAFAPLELMNTWEDFLDLHDKTIDDYEGSDRDAFFAYDTMLDLHDSLKRIDTSDIPVIVTHALQEKYYA